MNFAALNWMAIGACFLFSVVSGALYFGPKTFFPAWWLAIGKRADDKPEGTPVTWVLLMLSSFLQAWMVYVIVTAVADRAGTLTVASGAATGFFLWLGIVAPSGLANKLFAGQIKAWLIETGNALLNYVVFGAIIAVLK